MTTKQEFLHRDCESQTEEWREREAEVMSSQEESNATFSSAKAELSWRNRSRFFSE